MLVAAGAQRQIAVKRRERSNEGSGDVDVHFLCSAWSKLGIVHMIQQRSTIFQQLLCSLGEGRGAEDR